MTTKEKADDLINEFYRRITGVDEDSYDSGWEDAKMCAEYHVDLLIEAMSLLRDKVIMYNSVLTDECSPEYWQEVKEYIRDTVFV